MASAALEPWTNAVRLDESSTLRTHRYADRFSVVRVETTGPLTGAVRKSSSVPALLVSIFTRPIAVSDYRLWVDGKIVPTGRIAAFRSNVIDLEAEPASWADRGFENVHFHVRRGAINDAATDLGYEQVGAFRSSVAEDDIVLAQIAKSFLPLSGQPSRLLPLALDHLELIIGAHIVQRYSAMRPRRKLVGRGLAKWQRARATEHLQENLDGSVRLADLARECQLSVSHFARSFKASFGITCHQWLTEQRIVRAKDLMARTTEPLAEVRGSFGFRRSGSVHADVSSPRRPDAGPMAPRVWQTLRVRALTSASLSWCTSRVRW
jgi:AraC family transcriptional regulator